jgi:hypothetical protein
VIQPPSAQHNFDIIWSGDDALDRPGSDASPEAKAEFDCKFEQARLTGDWAGVLKPGQLPTRFEVRHIPGSLLRELFADDHPGVIMAAYALRLGLVAVRPVDGFDLKLEKDPKHPAYGKIAAASVVDWLDANAPGCVNELGLAILERSQGLSPKS